VIERQRRPKNRTAFSGTAITASTRCMPSICTSTTLKNNCRRSSSGSTGRCRTARVRRAAPSLTSVERRAFGGDRDARAHR
jgi:hypothetical protein